MRNAILLHGLPDEEEYFNETIPSASNSHWFPWLQNQLMVNDIKADTPEVFRCFEMNLESWTSEVERYDINQNTTLVGHSMGGGFWIRYLSEHPEIRIDKLLLVAPWMDVNHEYNSTFFDFELDTSLIKRVGEMTILASDNDSATDQASVNYLHGKFPDAKFRLFHNYGHFTSRSLPINTFPELLEVIL